MPATLEDPRGPATHRALGDALPLQLTDSNLPDTVIPRQVTLRDRITTATLLPVLSASHVPANLLSYLAEQLNREIEKGDTYPMLDPLTVPEFGQYWFPNFSAIMVMGDVNGIANLLEMERNGADWSKLCLGSFYVKPNYPGRSSHVCTGGFLVTDAARNKGVGRLMGEGYLDWAPRLGYSYSVFNLVYETNVVSCRIWDALGFKRIGRVKGAGALKSHTDELIDAIIYGRDLGSEGEDFVSEERFDKIRYYLKHSKYPAGADRAEKSRLRSAATHYKLLPSTDGAEERLMLKDKEVVSDPQRQYEIARQLHAQTHGGINKTTASIAERYHWVRIKETVSLVIKNCPECKESSKTAGAALTSGLNNNRKSGTAGTATIGHDPNRDIERVINLDQNNQLQQQFQSTNAETTPVRRPRKSTVTKPESETPLSHSQEALPQQTMQNMQQPQQASLHHHQPVPQSHESSSLASIHPLRYDGIPLDPQMMPYAAHGLAPDGMGHPMDQHNMTAPHGSMPDHRMHPHQSLRNDHNLGPHPHHHNLANLSLGTHNLANDPSGIQQHSVNGNMHNVEHGLSSVDGNMHHVNQNLGHAVDNHPGMHVNMGVMGHNDFDMGMGSAQSSGVAVGADDRMDTDADVSGEMGHHLIEAGFGGANHGQD